jgi:hypothetical protein
MVLSPTEADKHTQNNVNVLLGNSVRVRTKTDPVCSDAYCFNVLAAVVRFIAAFVIEGWNRKRTRVMDPTKAFRHQKILASISFEPGHC